MPFDADELRRTTFVRHVEIHDTLGSTNDRAAELSRDLADDELPALVVTRLQTTGRGRGTHTWWSAEGSLTFSLLLDPAHWQLTQRDWPQLSLRIADAVAAALQAEVSNAEVSVKPPNDILINGRKVCGILIESPGGAAPAKDRLIIGIGINVNNAWQYAPLLNVAGTSLMDVTGHDHNPANLLSATLNEIQRRLVDSAIV